MAKKVFFSFHYVPDNWRVSQVRQMGVIEDNPAVKDNDWETITKGGDAAIQKWIDSQITNRTCAVILVGENTANRKWINYEIKKAWANGLGIVGIHIHGLKNVAGETARMGSNPFSYTGHADAVKLYNPAGSDSKAVYKTISDNLDAWVTEAITIRNKYAK